MSAARFEGQRVVVTGAGQGIGRRVAECAAAEGARLGLIDRAENVHELAAQLGGGAHARQANLEDWDEAERAIAACADTLGGIDVLVNNVGGTIWARPYGAYEPAQIEAEIRRSLFPTLWCCRAALPALLASGGNIVNVSSVATRGVHRVPYAAAKGGVNAMTVSLAFEYAEQGIRVNAVAPGGTAAPPRVVPRNSQTQTDEEKDWYQAIVDQTKATSFMGRYGNLDEQAGPILFLASDAASYITGTVLPVAGGDSG
ncbi:benzoate diol dehydrogenase BenD [Salinisphaera orenii]|uniref:1,6-dihydroxycyclohexa-2,4-diene-1-carboxylate dehydrogenase n=1 Tax=Salinisphaera orenii YIM 95161 TaxID=1051139 RepID=A0A423PEW6_9GAMM|nr:benzoate diol dehydrogenase BenD [Salinisphaera halophila]ROO24171.1 1,6-dihydroxycyclohexa-2,4-diene-1-carboxylate dehydrogenase [Salinisphaera halophila YIM 95161]